MVVSMIPQICEFVKMREKAIKNLEGVFYRENFKISPFTKTIDKLFTLRQRYKDKDNDLLQGLVKLLMNNLYGIQVRRILMYLINLNCNIGWEQNMMIVF